MSGLPIESILPQLLSTLETDTSAVLVAPPGAGKTTRVPIALLGARWLGDRRLVMLEPRRLAARGAATHMARLLGEPVGATVGYRIRHETKVSRRTRIEVVTEGVLTRMLIDDPALTGVGAVLFDEFHERSIHADAGLAMTLQARALDREDLRVVIMSATLDAAPIATLLGDARIVQSEGRNHPVETHFLDEPVTGPYEPVVARTIRRALAADEGDVLVFLPGAAEIERVFALLDELPPSVRVHRLHGTLSQADQDAALSPAPAGIRKVVLASAIAETSLTIEGVRVVVDAGWMRVPRLSARIGMTRLETVRVTRASADQRRGRAGRTAPGVCYRLWTRAEDASLLPRGVPEILETDLAPLVLDLAAWGVGDVAELQWLDSPPAGALAQATELLRELGALDAAGMITSHGRAIGRLPLHPRLGHMLLVAAQHDELVTACEIAALIDERDILRGAGEAADPDLLLRIEALHGRRVIGADVDRAGAARVRRSARDLTGRVRIAMGGMDDERGAPSTQAPSHKDSASPQSALAGRSDTSEGMSVGALLARSYPDRVGRARESRGAFVLRNGRGARVPPHSSLAGADWIVAASADGRGADSRVLLGASLTQAEVLAAFEADLVTERVVTLEDTRVRVREVQRLGAIVLRDVVRRGADDADVARAVLDAIRVGGIAALPWTDAHNELRARLGFLHTQDGDAWPDTGDDALAATAGDWLLPFLAGTGGDLQQVDLAEALLARVAWERRSALDTLAPTHIEVPSGSRIRIDYGDPAAPVLAARLQELFGWTDSPRIMDGRVPLTIHVLSPARRPVQVTRDLASFWRTGYFDVRRDLRGRYPKHYWPDDPLTATATRRVRPR